MNVFKGVGVLRLLGSMRLTLMLLALFALAIAWATFIEADLGPDGAKALVYNSRWFEGVLLLLGLNVLASLLRRFPYRARMTGFLIVHVAIIVILTGAALTRFSGYEGVMSIREGETVDSMYSRNDHVQLRVGDEVATFPVRLYRTGEQSLVRELDIGGQAFTVAVEEYWAHHENKLALLESGPPGLRLTLEEGADSREIEMLQGDEIQAGEFRVWYLARLLSPVHGSNPNGWLRIKSGESSHSLAVPSAPPTQIRVGEYVITIEDFHSDYQTGAHVGSRPLMSNPMIEVTITGPGGATETRNLFAYYPELSTRPEGHFGGLAAIETSYEIPRTLLIAGGEEGLVARCSLPLEKIDMGVGEGGDVFAAGEEFPVDLEAVYRCEGADVGLRLREFLPSAGWALAASDDPDAPAALSVTVCDKNGGSASARVSWGMGDWREISLPGVSAAIAFGPRLIKLPYRLQLDDFILKTYPGSEKPAGYESRVRLFDDERGIQGRSALIAMNHPLSHRGYKHFQSSYDEDHRGAVLTVNYDPGTWPTYLGYALITIGFLLSLLKDLIWPRRDAEGAEAGGAA